MPLAMSPGEKLHMLPRKLLLNAKEEFQCHGIGRETAGLANHSNYTILCAEQLSEMHLLIPLKSKKCLAVFVYLFYPISATRGSPGLR